MYTSIKTLQPDQTVQLLIQPQKVKWTNAQMPDIFTHKYSQTVTVTVMEHAMENGGTISTMTSSKKQNAKFC